MATRRLLLLLKPWDVYPIQHHSNGGISRVSNPKEMQVLRHLESRRKVQQDSVNFCQKVLRKKFVDWTAIMRGDLLKPIRDVDLVVTIGGDGTLLHASHFVDDSIPVLGVNSDPTQPQEVEKFSDEVDASRSTGHLCAATVNNFENILDDILENRRVPSLISRMLISVNSELLSTHALNDILIADPCPATVSQFSFRIIQRDGKQHSPLVHCRSSGLRVSTAAGSTAAMLSAGGFVMPIFSKDLQFMVREPILSSTCRSKLKHGIGKKDKPMHGFVKPDESMEVSWFCKEGKIYIDGSNNFFNVRHGDIIELSSNAPVLKIFLPQRLL
ncbi:NADH kinase [Impatiens glandulifera]|uniref:NADH kinase n=1 Tax=Impatiens glandulifera TaxID=253017 RepID=UPI001FB0DAE5|nr:NADH kinase [Impatiens glandulifera]